MLAALLLAALPQQGWQVEELPMPDRTGGDGPHLVAPGGRLVHFVDPAGGGYGRDLLLLDERTGTWSRIAGIPDRFPIAAAGDASGLAVVMTNGQYPTGWEHTLHWLDFATGAWRDLPPIGDAIPRWDLACHDGTLVALTATLQETGTWTGGMHRLDLRAADPRWVELPWPGAASNEPAPVRHYPGLAVQGAGAAGASLYLMGGSRPAGEAGWLADCWRLDFASWSWHRLPDLPEPDAYGPLAFGATELLLFGDTTWSMNTVTGQWVDRGTALLPLPGGLTPRSLGDRIVQFTSASDTDPYRLVALSLPKAEAALRGVDIVVLVGYLALLIGLGAWFSRREKSTEDYFLAGRRIPWWAAGLSLFATQLSAITFLGTPAVSYATDWMLLPSWFGILFFAPLAVYVFLPLYRARPMRTVYTWLEWRYGVAARLFGSASFIAFQLLRMGVVVYLPSLALATATGLETWQCVLLMGVLATIYTVLGGMEAVVWTDVLQTCVLLVGVGATLWVVFSTVGHPLEAMSAAAEAGKLRAVGGGWSTVEAATWSLVLGGLFLQFGPYTADQAMVQRYLTTKDQQAAARGIWLNGWMSVPAGALFILVGTALWLYYRARPESLALGIEADAVFPLFLAQELPAGLSGLVIAGLFAAAMSTLDSGMHAVATTLTTDWVERLGGREAPLRLARTLTVVAGAAATLIAVVLGASGILSSLLFFLKTLGLLTSGVAGVFLLGVLSKRATQAGALCGAAVGIPLLAYVAFATPTDLFVYPLVGIPATVIAGWLASRLGIGRAPAAA